MYTFWQQTEASTAVEYGLIAVGISLAIATLVFAFGESLVGVYDYMSTRMSDILTKGFGG